MDLNILKYEAVNTNIMTAAAVEGMIETSGDLAADTTISMSDVKILDLDAICEKDKLIINAEVEFTVMCSSEDGTYSLSAKTCFDHSINVDGADQNMTAKINTRCSDVDSRITADGKIELKTLVEFNADIVESVTKEVAVVEENMDVETDSLEISYLQETLNARGLNVIREDLKLPDRMPQIDSVLFKSAQFVPTEVLTQQESVYVVGDLQVCVVYKNDNKANMAKFNVPGEVIISGNFVSDGIVSVKPHIREINLKVYEDDSGERNIIAVECPIVVDAVEYVGCTGMVVSDAFSTKLEANVVKDNVKLPIMSSLINAENCTVDAPVQINAQPLSVPMVCANSTEVSSVAVGEGNAMISGSIEVLTFDEVGKCTKGYVPFDCIVMLDSQDADTSDITVDVTCTDIECYINNDSILCARGAVTVKGECSGHKTWRLVTRIESGEMYDECERPLLLAIAQIDDNTWSIAKRCRVKVDDLYNLNPDLENGIKPGMVIVALRK